MPSEAASVFHYTNGAGLLGILDKGSIWCTHIRFLNDTQEIRLGKLLYSSVLQDLCDDSATEPFPGARSVAQFALSRIDHTYDPPATLRNPDDYFVSSFSEEADDLSQWRGYSTGNIKVCIGFSTSGLSKVAALEAMEFHPVSYDNASISAAMRRNFLDSANLLWQAHEKSNYHPGRPESWHPPEILGLNRRIMSTGSPFVKHESFVREQEHRLATSTARPLTLSTNSDVNFRAGKSLVVPYISVPLIGAGPLITSITIGPCPYPAEAVYGVEVLLFQARRKETVRPLLSSDLRIAASKIPFRDWH